MDKILRLQTPIRCLLFVVGLGAALGAGELTARHRLGLGTPPLYVADTLTEYRLKPNQNLRRFGNRIEVNAFSMRAAPSSPTRPVGAQG